MSLAQWQSWTLVCSNLLQPFQMCSSQDQLETLVSGCKEFYETDEYACVVVLCFVNAIW